ncbi:MAG: OmpH family outer membrane protein [Rikenellaceae bacterium]|nr:OmpH family outer membrane protein [Rikenellaceae bacterium]
MRNLIKLSAIKLVIVGAIFLFGGTSLKGQQIKLGYINSNELLAIMPETDSARIVLENLSNELGQQLDEINVEFNNKYQAYTRDAAEMTQSVRAQKEKELQDLSVRLQQFQQDAQKDLDLAQRQLMAPVFEKVQEAIQKVARNNGFTTIIDAGVGVLLYIDESTMIDILPLVRAELGIN